LAPGHSRSEPFPDDARPLLGQGAFFGAGAPFLLKLRQEARQNQLDLSEIRFQWNENRPMNTGICR
jgi:hypothetical protein